MTDENVYSAPQSDVSTSIDTNSEIEAFPRKSAWAVFFLAVFTLGMYVYYWLYTRTKIINTLPNRKVSLLPITAIVVLFVITFILAFFSELNKGNTALTGLLAIIRIIFSILYLVALYSVRSELMHILKVSGASNAEIGGVRTFFFGTIYLQYKINQ